MGRNVHINFDVRDIKCIESGSSFHTIPYKNASYKGRDATPPLPQQNKKYKLKKRKFSNEQQRRMKKYMI